MPRQVSDEEYNFLQARKQVADFVESIYNDPQLAKDAKALIKRKYPNLPIPDYDIENNVAKQLAAERTERQQEEDKKRKAEEDENFRRIRKKTQDDYGFTDDAMDRLEKMMVEKNIGDYEAAATYMASKEPRPVEATARTHWNHEKQDGFKEIAKDPEGWARDQIMGAIQADERAAKGGRY